MEHVVIGTKIKLERMAHVTNEKVNKLAESPIDDGFFSDVRDTADTYRASGDVREVVVESVGADSKGRNPWVAVWFGGLVTFRLNSGWGEKPVRDYRIESRSLKRLRDFVSEEKGWKVAVKRSRPGSRRRAARRPKAAPDEQERLFTQENQSWLKD